MTLLQKIPHPLSLLRDKLIAWRAPPLRLVRSSALNKGYSLTKDTSFFRSFRRSGRDVACYRSAVGEKSRSVYAALLDELKSNDIPFFTGGGTDAWLLSLNIASRDTRLVLDLVRRLFGTDENIVAELANGRMLSCAKLPSAGTPLLRLLCVEQKSADLKLQACSWIEINAWKEVPSYTKARVFETASINPHVRRLRAETMERLLSETADIDEMDKTLGAVPRFPIDVVYTWVNDKDPAWQAERARHSGRQAQTELARSNLDERFTNRDELRYSLRSIEMFAPFVRNIYLVTCGHAPSWLNIDHPRLKVVTHEQIYANRTHLPTFNSSSIETQLHHIEGLAEHFLYFNDDFFLGDFCLPEDFFHANGLIKSFATEQKAFEHDIDETSEEYIAADGNAIRLIKERFGTFTRDLMLHAPYPASRTLIKEMEETFPKEFDACASKRFRSHDDLRPIAFMQYHYGFQKQKSVPASISNKYIALWKPSIDQLFADMLKNRRYKTFCINDVGIPPSRMNWTNRQVAEFLASYYPFKSSFEK